MKLTHYDLELDDLADLAGTFQARKFADTENWIRRQWSRLADELGFREALDRQLYQRSRRRRLVNAESLAVFSRWFETRVQPKRDPEQARVRALCLAAIRRSPGSRWLTDLDSQNLPESACFIPMENTQGSSKVPSHPAERLMMRVMRPAVQPRSRAFRSDVTASFFHDPDPRRGEGCSYRVKLSLGTFPYVYGRNLGLEPPALFWASEGKFRPAVEAMRIASSMWSQAGNLAQDARIVVAHYQRFRKNAGQVLDRKAPGSRDSKTGLMRRGLRPITSVRGVLSAKGHNLTLRAFAAFFAARRAYLSAPESLSPEARKALRNNPDPILRQQLRVA